MYKFHNFLVGTDNSFGKRVQYG